MITAVNGMLIVSMLFVWGIHAGSRWLMAAALASAGVAWLINFLDGIGAIRPTVRNLLACLSIALAAVGLFLAASTLI